MNPTPLRLVSATERAVAQPDVCRIIHQDTELAANEAFSLAGDALEIRRLRAAGDIAGLNEALVRYGIHARAAVRLWVDMTMQVEMKREIGQ